MPMRITDPIMGSTRGSAQEAKTKYANTAGVKRLSDLNDYLDEVWRLCKIVGLDASIVAAQFDLETGHAGAIPQPGIPSYWERDLNPGGIGIWKDGVPSPFKISTGQQAALIHVAALFGKVNGELHETLKPALNLANDWITRLINGVNNEDHPNVAFIDDLNIKWGPNLRECTWACDPDYQDKFVSRGRWLFPNLPDVGSNPTPAYNWEPIPFPNYKNMIVPKAHGGGFNRVPPRQNIGLCRHGTAGGGTIEGIFNYFNSNDPHGKNALTDWVIGRDGRIGMLNDPQGTRSPWANGGSDGLEGDGPAFVRQVGIAAINARLESIEHIATVHEYPTDLQFQASVKLQAAIHQRAKMPWDQYPFHPKYNTVTDMEHYEFATKDCPFKYREWTDRFQDGVRGLLKLKQTTGEPPPVDPVDPVDPPNPIPSPGLEYPAGMDEAIAKRAFGVLVRRNPDGSTNRYGFDPKGAISNAWLARGRKDKEFPEAHEWLVFVDDPKNPALTRDLVIFKNGWLFGRPNPTVIWDWIGDLKQTGTTPSGLQ